MPSRLALGRSTKARARFEALLRVIVRLSSMNGASEQLLRGLLGRGGRLVRSMRGQPAGFAQGRIARSIVRMIAAAAAAAAAAGEEAGGMFAVAGPVPGAGEGGAGAAAAAL